MSQGVSIQTITEHRGAPITSLDSFYSSDDNAVMWLAASRDRRVTVWKSSTTNSSSTVHLVDLLTFPAPHFATDLVSHQPDADFTYWLKYPPSLAQFERPARRSQTAKTTSPIETLIYSGYGLNKEIVVYDFVKKMTVRTIGLSEYPECWAVSSAKTGLIALGTRTRLVQLKEMKSGAFQDFAFHADKVSSACFSRDGKRLFTTSYNEIFIWDVNV